MTSARQPFAQRCPRCPWRGVSRARSSAFGIFLACVAGALVYVYLGSAGRVPQQPIPAVGVALLVSWGGTTLLLRRERCPSCGARGLQDG